MWIFQWLNQGGLQHLLQARLRVTQRRGRLRDQRTEFRLHEPAHRLLMLLNAWAGDRPGALEAYRRFVAVANTELGVAPLEETTELYEAILDEDLPPAPGVRRRVVAHQATAPVPVNGLLDRETEFSGLRAALDTVDDAGHVGHDFGVVHRS